MHYVNKSRSAIQIYLMTVIVMIAAFLLFSCGGSDSGDGGGGGGGTGAMAFSLAFEGPVPAAAPASPSSAFTCTPGFAVLETIEAEVLDENGDLLVAGGPWDCEDHEGTIEDVQAGSKRTVQIWALDGYGNMIYDGKIENVNVAAGETTQAGTVLLSLTNNDPILDPIGAQQVNEGQTLEFWLSMDDPDTSDNLSCSAENLPPEADFDSSSCKFSWTPGFDQDGIYPVTFTIWDNGIPSLSASEEVTITVSNVILDPPGNLRASDGTSEAAILLSWSPAVNANEYKIFRYDSETAGWVQIGPNLNANQTSFVDDIGLSCGSYEHEYVVRASNEGGDSENSNADSGFTKMCPTQITGIAAGINTVTVTWDAIPGAIAYTLYWSDENGVSKGSTKLTDPAIASTTFLHEANSRNNYYAVTASNELSESNLSNEVYSNPWLLTPIVTMGGKYCDIDVNLFDNSLHVSYVDSSDRPFYITNYDGLWSDPLLLSVRGGETVGGDTAISVDEDNHAYISFWTAVNEVENEGWETHRLHHISNRETYPAFPAQSEVLYSYDNLMSDHLSLDSDLEIKSGIPRMVYYQYNQAADNYAVTVASRNSNGAWTTAQPEIASLFDFNNLLPLQLCSIAAEQAGYHIGYLHYFFSVGLLRSPLSNLMINNMRYNMSFSNESSGNGPALRYAFGDSIGVQTPSTVDDRSDFYWSIALALGQSSARPHLSYYAVEQDIEANSYLVTSNYAVMGNTEWERKVLQDWTDPTISDLQQHNISIAVDSSEKVHIAYIDPSDKSLQYAFGSIQGFVTIPLDSSENDKGYVSAAIDGNDIIHLVYFYSENETDYLAYATRQLYQP
jgi:hypothetical protein